MNLLNRLCSQARSRKNTCILIISLISLFFIFLNLIQITIIIGSSMNSFFLFIFRTLVIISTIFVILFLPSYPLFFLIVKKKDFNVLEKLSITIVTNTGFYILTGYIGFYIGISITGLYFFVVSSLSYLLLIFILIFQQYRGGEKVFIKTHEIHENETNVHTIFTQLTGKVSKNAFFLIIFILLVCLLNLARNPYFFGTDPWYHLTIIKKITEMHYLPLLDYHNELGFHVFGAVIQFFSGVDYLYIPRYFVFFTYFISALILYNILMLIFKNQNLSILGVFILEFSMLGFSYMMLQFWPSGLAFIIGLEIFFLFYSRLQNFILLRPPDKQQMVTSMKFSYSLIIFLFISSAFTHAITTIILLLPLVSTYLVYFLKSYRRGIDFILLILLLGIYLILTFAGLGYGHYYFIQPFNLPWYLFIPVGAGGAWIIWRFKKSLLFTKGRYKKAIMGEQSTFIKKIEDKFIIPIITVILITIIIAFLIANILILNLDISFFFLIFDIFAFFSFSFWGLAIFQKKPRGKPITMWALSINFIFLGVFFVDLLTVNEKVWTRVLYLGSVAIIIGFLSYIYKLKKTGYIHRMKYKVLLLFIIFFSISATAYYDHVGISNFSMKHREVHSFQWLAQYTSGKIAMHTEFGHDYVFLYYDYPYNEDNKSIKDSDIIIVISFEENYFPPENQIVNGVNQLQKLKQQYGTDVYIIVDNFYFLNVGWQVYGHLSKEQQEQYYHLDYLNKVHSSKDENGVETPYYWVI